MNLMVVGKDVDNIVLDIHKYRASKYYVLTNIHKLGDWEFRSFIKGNDTIFVVDPSVIESYSINYIIDFCERYEVGITLVGEGSGCIEENIYYNLVTRFPSSIIYWQRNKENKDYDELIEGSVAILDYTIRASN